MQLVLAQGVGPSRCVRVGLDLVQRHRAEPLLKERHKQMQELIRPEELARLEDDPVLVFACKEALAKAMGCGLFAAEKLRQALASAKIIPPCEDSPLRSCFCVRCPSREAELPRSGFIIRWMQLEHWTAVWAMEHVDELPPSRWAVVLTNEGTLQGLHPEERRSCLRRPVPQESVSARQAARYGAQALGVTMPFRVRLSSRGAPQSFGAPLLLSLSHDGGIGAALVAERSFP